MKYENGLVCSCGSLAREDLAHGSLLADVFLGCGRLVFDLGWIFTLI
jgi:hypothetical protein